MRISNQPAAPGRDDLRVVRFEKPQWEYTNPDDTEVVPPLTT